jgi:hypothetical protein
LGEKKGKLCRGIWGKSLAGAFSRAGFKKPGTTIYCILDKKSIPNVVYYTNKR